MSAYLLPWTPSSFANNKAEMGTPTPGDTSEFLGQQHAEVGSRIYFVKTDDMPIGIVAVGTMMAGSKVRLSEVRLSFNDGLLPHFVLVNQFPDQNWESDYVLTSYEEPLAMLWETGTGRHSLEAAMLLHKATLSTIKEERKPIWDAVDRIKKGEFDTEDMRLLWEKQENGITTVMAAKISEADFYKNLSLLKEFTAAILANPYSETLIEIMNRWKPAFPDNNPAVIHRVFRALAPDLYTFSAVGKIKEIYKPLSKHFGFPKFVSKDWCEDSNSFIRLVRDACKDQWHVKEIEHALWRIHKWHEKADKVDGLGQRKSKKSTPVTPTTTDKNAHGVNTILYGPPGTGKTYRVIERAVKAAKPELNDCQDREQLKAEYDALLASGRIRFVTFHQSFSYEEFIEGLRAETNEAGQISYSVNPGVFKQISDDASGKKLAGSPLDKAIEAFKGQLESENTMTLKTKRGRSFRVEYHDNKAFRAFPENSINENLANGYAVSIEHIWSEYQGLNRDRPYTLSYAKAILRHLIDEYNVPAFEESVAASAPESFVLIIDEINRGNISKIFGELITLIEPSKRAGQKEALSVQLPYSGDTFTVPANLHIIGTMNTADRSLATMDTALRRRFDFIEMMPDYRQLDAMTVKGINIGALLRTLNDRIEYLYDREHTLGHAFFMPIAEKENEQDKFDELGSIFKKKILPLLQEYFFEDWGKIRLILGDNRKGETALQFVTKQESDVRYLFGDDFPSDELSDAREVYAINDDAFANPGAYLRVISQ